MTNRLISRFGVIAALLLTATLAYGQEPLPMPSVDQGQQQGAQATPSPFYVPDEYAPAVRSTAYFVTTTVDEDDGACDPTGAGLSLREALTYCSSFDHVTVYVPAGEYLLNSAIDPIFNGLILVGEDPETTIIENAAGTDRIFNIEYAFDLPVTLMNLTFQGGNTTGYGGAISYQGYGSLNIYNSIFDGNHAQYGGAIYVEDNGYPVDATIRRITFVDNSADYDGGALYFYASDHNANHLLIQFSLFSNNESNQTGCDSGGGAVTMFSDATDYGDTLTIDDSTFDTNASLMDCSGGAVRASAVLGYLSVSISFTDFLNNYAGGWGGAVSLYNPFGTLNVNRVEFEGNSSDYAGGAISDYKSHVSISESDFIGNSSGIGGAVELRDGGGASIIGSYFDGNTATSEGGALFIESAPAYIGETYIVRNTSSFGGGISVYDHGLVLHNSLVEDNSAPEGPDCYNDGATINYDPVTSLGGVGITNTDDCSYVPHHSDQFDNLLDNGGFEFASGNAKKPDDWVVTNATGEKRACNTSEKRVTFFGSCAYLFTGSVSGAILSQSVDADEIDFDFNDQLTLFAMGEGAATSNVSVELKVKYATGSPSVVKTKIKLKNSTGYASKNGTLLLTGSDITSISVSIVDKSPSGKFYLDRVYLYDTSSMLNRDGSSSAVLPPPDAPDGMRGGN